MWITRKAWSARRSSLTKVFLGDIISRISTLQIFGAWRPARRKEMRKLAVFVSLMFALAALSALAGCAVSRGPSRVVLTLEGQPLYPERPDGPYRLTLVNSQREAVFWTIVVYSGSQRLEDVVDSRDGVLRFRDGAVAVFGVGPRLGRLVAMGVVQLARGAYTVVGIPKTGTGRILGDRPAIYTFTTTGWGLNATFRDGDFQITSDAIWTLPWADIQRRNPLNFEIRLPSPTQEALSLLSRGPTGPSAAMPVQPAGILPTSRAPADMPARDDLPHRFFGSGGDKSPLVPASSPQPVVGATPATPVFDPVQGKIHNGLPWAVQVKIYGARLQSFDLAPGASREIRLDAPSQMLIATVEGREVARQTLLRPSAGPSTVPLEGNLGWKAEIGK